MQKSRNLDNSIFQWLKKKVEKKNRKNSVQKYTGFIVNSLIVKEGDCVLINASGYLNEELEWARVLECFSSNEKKVRGFAKVQWYSPIGIIKKQHLKSFKKDLPPLNADLDVIKDMNDYGNTVDVETISALCHVIEIPASTPPENVKRPDDNLPFRVCRFSYKNCKQEQCLIEFTQYNLNLKHFKSRAVAESMLPAPLENSKPQKGDPLENKLRGVKRKLCMNDDDNAENCSKRTKLESENRTKNFSANSSELENSRHTAHKVGKNIFDLNCKEDNCSKKSLKIKKENNSASQQSQKENKENNSTSEKSQKIKKKNNSASQQSQKVNKENNSTSEKSQKIKKKNNSASQQSQKVNKENNSTSEKSQKIKENNSASKQSQKENKENNSTSEKSQKIKKENNSASQQSQKENKKNNSTSEKSQKIKKENNPASKQSQKENKENNSTSEKSQKIKKENNSASKQSQKENKENNSTSKNSPKEDRENNIVCDSKSSRKSKRKLSDNFTNEDVENSAPTNLSNADFNHNAEGKNSNKNLKKIENIKSIGQCRGLRKNEISDLLYDDVNSDSESYKKKKVTKGNKISKKLNLKDDFEKENSNCVTWQNVIEDLRAAKEISVPKARGLVSDTENDEKSYSDSEYKDCCDDFKIFQLRENQFDSDQNIENFSVQIENSPLKNKKIPLKNKRTPLINEISPLKNRRTPLKDVNRVTKINENSPLKMKISLQSLNEDRRKTGFHNLNKHQNTTESLTVDNINDIFSDDEDDETIVNSSNSSKTFNKCNKSKHFQNCNKSKILDKSKKLESFNKSSESDDLEGQGNEVFPSIEDDEHGFETLENDKSYSTRITPNNIVKSVCKSSKKSFYGKDSLMSNFEPSKLQVSKNDANDVSEKDCQIDDDSEDSTAEQSEKFNKKNPKNKAEKALKRKAKRKNSKNVEPEKKEDSSKAINYNSLKEEMLNAFKTARVNLHVSAVPQFLPCRENEFQQIFSFVEGKLTDASNGCMYVSGVPGTGKTATVREVYRMLNDIQNEGSMPGFHFVEINAMKLTKPNQLWAQMWTELTGKKATPEHSYHLIVKYLQASNPKRKNIFLLLDELDLLWTRKQDVMYNLFELTSKSESRLVVVTIANTMDLPERMMINRVSSRLGLTRMTFHPYSFQQLQEIIDSRLRGINAFDPDAIQLVSRKVAAISGDARRALDICRRSTEIAENDFSSQFEVKAEKNKSSKSKKRNKKSKNDVSKSKKRNKETENETEVESGKLGVVGMLHISKAIEEMFSSPKVLAIKRSSELEKTILRAVLLEFQRVGMEEAVLIRVLEHLNSICILEDIFCPSYSVSIQLINNLSATRILLTEHSRVDLALRIRLNMSTDDVEFALNP